MAKPKPFRVLRKVKQQELMLTVHTPSGRELEMTVQPDGTAHLAYPNRFIRVTTPRPAGSHVCLGVEPVRISLANPWETL